MRAISRFVFWARRWELDSNFPEGIEKAVVVHAPHTSNWDFFYGYMAFRIYRRKIRFLVKKEAFKGFKGKIVKNMGGLPVDRSKKTNIVEQVVELINTHDDILIMFTPEGSRSKAEEWKSGFFHVATQAKVPIVLSYIDYSKRKAGFMPTPELTGDVATDIENIRKCYIGIGGKIPEQGVF